MEVSQLYDFVLLIVLVGMILGVGLLVLANFTNAISGDAGTSVNNTITALGPIASTWIPLIVTIASLAIILILVIRSFGGIRR